MAEVLNKKKGYIYILQLDLLKYGPVVVQSNKPFPSSPAEWLLRPFKSALLTILRRWLLSPSLHSAPYNLPASVSSVAFLCAR